MDDRKSSEKEHNDGIAKSVEPEAEREFEPKEVDSRTSILSAVRTPLALLTLLVLVIEGGLVAAVALANSEQLDSLIYGFLFLTFLILCVVVYFEHRRQHPGYGDFEGAIVEQTRALNDKIDQQTSALRRAIDQSDVHLKELFSAFSTALADEEIDGLLRRFLVLYPDVINRDDNVLKQKIGDEVRALVKISEERAFHVYYSDVSLYPRPFYEKATGGIKATNTGDPKQFWMGESESQSLVEMNRVLCERLEPGAEARRVFVCSEKDLHSGGDYHELVHRLVEAGVRVKWIEPGRAAKIANDVTPDLGLLDFTVFATPTLKYSGELRNTKYYKRVKISANEDHIAKLERQFDALWDASADYVERRRIWA